jgi:uncharacterized membrane protein YccF (DUF307 family)
VEVLEPMSVIGNLLWAVLGGGIIFFVIYLLAGCVLCLSIIGIPFGVQCLKLSMLALVPFGKDIQQTKFASGCTGSIFNIIWLVLVGWELAILHLVFALIDGVTIVGLPFARQHMKMVSLELNPFGHKVT